MQELKTTKPGSGELAMIKHHLQTLYPGLKRIRVKHYYNCGKVTVRAEFENKSLLLRCCANAVFERFSERYHQRSAA